MYDSSFTLPSTSFNTSPILDKIASFRGGSNENDKVFVFIWNQKDQIIFLTKQLEEELKLNNFDVQNLKWMEILPRSIVSAIRKHFNLSQDQYYLTPFSYESYETSYFSGIVTQFMVNDEIIYVCELAERKVSEEWKELLAEMEKLSLSSQMAASLVHEIRNPLTSLKGFLQLIQSGIEQKEEYFKVIINEIDKLEQISAELLHISRPTLQEKTIENVQSLVEDVVFLQKTQVDMRNINFDVNIKNNLMIECNPSQIKQVLINLVRNASEAMEKSGVIKINGQLINDEVHVDIIDNGIGISTEAVAELVNPYYTTKLDGTGLGLVVSNHILVKHEGRLEVDSKENKGTKFTIVLPVHEQ